MDSEVPGSPAPQGGALPSSAPEGAGIVPFPDKAASATLRTQEQQAWT